MLRVVGWRVYCEGGVTYESDPQSIPPTVQVVVWFHAPPYRTLEAGQDFYEVDGVLLTGKEIPLADYEAIRATALADVEWPA